MRMSLISTEWPLPSLNSTVASARRLGLSGGVMALTDTCIGYSSCRGNRAIEDELFYGFARDANEAANFTKCNLATENPRPQRRRFDPQQRRRFGDSQKLAAHCLIAARRASIASSGICHWSPSL